VLGVWLSLYARQCVSIYWALGWCVGWGWGVCLSTGCWVLGVCWVCADGSALAIHMSGCVLVCVFTHMVVCVAGLLEWVSGGVLEWVSG